MVEIKKAKEIMGQNFIGPDELLSIKRPLSVLMPKKIPTIKYTEEFLEEHKNNYILIFGPSLAKNGVSLTINFLRECFGVDPEINEPCMYNQDWYLKEDFAKDKTLEDQWYLIEKKVQDEIRGLSPENILESFDSKANFPLAILTTFTFFVYYFLSKEMLWKNDFVWCQDVDSNGDRVYVGCYVDSNKKNKNGFNIHRHLRIRSIYGAVKQYS